MAWQRLGEVAVVADDDAAIALSDQYAPEHLEVQTRRNDYYLAKLKNYGSLFLGEESTVAYGDKGVGTNHTLPTGRAGRYTGGLWVGKFLKTVTYQKLTRRGEPAHRAGDRPHVRGGGHARARAHRDRARRALCAAPARRSLKRRRKRPAATTGREPQGGLQ